jgi:RNA polymerase sigma-70 factor (ECF subfamily)
MKETANRKSLFDSLHQQYFPMVMQMCLGYMKGDTELAKDMAQDVFINTWKALDGF